MATVFNLGPLLQWIPVAMGDLMRIETPALGYREARFEIIADQRVSVRAMIGDADWLVGVGEGLLECRFIIEAPVQLVVEGPKAANVWMRSHVGTMVIDEPVDPSFATAEPKHNGPSAEMRRMLHLQRLNNDRREQMLMAEIQRLSVRVAPPAGPVKAATDPAVGDVIDNDPTPPTDQKTE